MFICGEEHRYHSWRGFLRSLKVMDSLDATAKDQQGFEDAPPGPFCQGDSVKLAHLHPPGWDLLGCHVWMIMHCQLVTLYVVPVTQRTHQLLPSNMSSVVARQFIWPCNIVVPAIPSQLQLKGKYVCKDDLKGGKFWSRSSGVLYSSGDITRIRTRSVGSHLRPLSPRTHANKSFHSINTDVLQDAACGTFSVMLLPLQDDSLKFMRSAVCASPWAGGVRKSHGAILLVGSSAGKQGLFLVLRLHVSQAAVSSVPRMQLCSPGHAAIPPS